MGRYDWCVKQAPGGTYYHEIWDMHTAKCVERGGVHVLFGNAVQHVAMKCLEMNYAPERVAAAAGDQAKPGAAVLAAAGAV